MNNSFSHHPSQSRHTLASTPENPAFWQGNTDATWVRLQQTPLDKLVQSQQSANAIDVGWLKLAVISKRYSMNTPQLARELLAWRKDYSSHPGNQLLPSDATLNALAASTPPKHIALLLPLSGKFAALGLAARNGFMQAYNTDLAKTGYNQDIAFYDTNSNANIAALYQEAVSKGANIVVGPLTKEDVKQITNQTTFTVPTVALNYSELGFGSLPANLYEFGLSPHDEAKQVADKAYDTGHKRAIIIAPQTEWGQTVAKTLVSRWESDGGAVADIYYFTPTSNLSNDIPTLLHIDAKQDRQKARDTNDKASLEQQRRQDFDVVFLLAAPQSARQIVPLLRYYYVDKTAIFSTSVVYAGVPQPQKDADLNGVHFCETPWALSHYSGGSEADAGASRLYAVGMDAYVISYDIDRFNALPNFPLYGATGAITLTPQRQFYRRLAWTQFHNGQV